MRIRPVTPDDHAAILTLAESAGIGMTSLPADADVLHDKIKKGVESFTHQSPTGDESFLFVLEDPNSDEVVGTTGIKSHIGRNQPFYSYRLNTITQQCRDLDILSKHQILNVTNDLTDASEIGSLFLKPQYRRDRLGRLLSLCRFMFIAAHPHYFADQVIAEMRGMHDRDGNSPFYNSIARHFFEMKFAQADYYNATRGNQFINDLMPKYPIYVSLLPKSARDVIGQPHPQSEPARIMLENEGFKWNGYIDVFDGGPTLQADTARLRTITQSKIGTITAIDDGITAEKYMISNERFDRFACCAGRLLADDQNQLTITPNIARLLAVDIGDTLRYIPHQTI